jgi:hypothetical protein
LASDFLTPLGHSRSKEDSVTVAGRASLVTPFGFDHNPTGILANSPCTPRPALAATRALLK